MSMIDASCPKCGKRFGWSGSMIDRPPCPRCGHQLPKEELEAADAAMDAFEERLCELRAANPDYDKWRSARVAAGLTLRQAAKILEVDPVTLSDIERGENKPSEALAARMLNCYGG